MAYSTKRVTPKQIHTTDQKLLQEIRDELEARPLATEFSRSDIDLARQLRGEIDLLNERLDRTDARISLLGRIAGLHPEELTDDEIELLGQAGAWTPEREPEPVDATLGSDG